MSATGCIPTWSLKYTGFKKWCLTVLINTTAINVLALILVKRWKSDVEMLPLVDVQTCSFGNISAVSSSCWVSLERLWVCERTRCHLSQCTAHSCTTNSRTSKTHHRIHQLNEAIVHHTSPALCTAITPPPAVTEWSILLLHYTICSLLKCIVNGKENPQNCPLPLGFCHPARGGPSHGHRQHAQKTW